MSRSSWKFQVVVQDGSRIYNQNLKSVVLARKEGRQSVQRLSIFEPVPFCSFVFWESFGPINDNTKSTRRLPLHQVKDWKFSH